MTKRRISIEDIDNLEKMVQNGVADSTISAKALVLIAKLLHTIAYPEPSQEKKVNEESKTSEDLQQEGQTVT